MSGCRKIPLILILICSASTALAVPAPPFPILVQNGDGTSFYARLYGDEHLSWATDLDGFAIRFDESRRAWCYAELSPTGDLRPTAYEVGKVDPAALGLARHLMPSPVRQAEARALQMLPNPVPRVSGSVPNLVLLVRFKNQSTTLANADYEPVFNGASGSVKAFYSEISYGQVNLVSTIVGWITLPYNDSYYVYNGANQTGRPWEMVTHAVAILNSQNFDFTRFDADGDGAIDAIDVIHSGPGYEYTGDPRYIHSHFGWMLNNQFQETTLYTHDGIGISTYHTEPEFRSDQTNPTQIGVIVHETAHFFGVPDLYDYGYDSGGLGLWCVMATGSWGGPNGDGTVPSHPSAWIRYRLGILTPTRILANMSGVTLRPVESNAEVYRLDAGMPSNQFFLLEDRRKTGSDAYLPGEGLLIYHVDEGQPNNDNQNRYLVDVEQADGLRELNKSQNESGDASDPWPYSAKTTFDATSTPNSIAYGQSTSKIAVRNITRAIQNITFDVTIDGSVGTYLALSPAAVGFSGTAGQAASPASQTVTVSHQGQSALTWTASPQASWIRLSVAQGTTPSAVAISADTTGLAAGSHLGTVRFTAPGATNSPQSLTVSLSLADAPPEFDFTPGALAFKGFLGLAVPPLQTLEIGNAGGGTLAWSAAIDQSWILLSSRSGVAPATINVAVDTSGLGVARHTGSIRFTSPTAPEGKVDLTLDLSNPAHLAVAPTALEFEATAGQSPPLTTQSIALSNTVAGAAITWSITCAATWLDCRPRAGSGPGAITVGIRAVAAKPGIEVGEVVISSPEADNSPLRVPVELTILAPNAPPSAPVLISPDDRAELEADSPELTVQNAVDPEQDTLTYDFEVFPLGLATAVFSAAGVAEGRNFTAVQVSPPLTVGQLYEWRARAQDSKGLASAWSDKFVFTVRPPVSGGCASAEGSGLSLLWSFLPLLVFRRRSRRA